MAKTIFITGTGTDIGKTYISALIVKKMREAGLNCGYYKPVLSGVEVENGKLVKSDCNYVVDVAKLPVQANECVTYWWEKAVSPHLAAKLSGQRIDVKKIKEDFKTACSKYDYLLVEGAGGITCPLILENNEAFLMKDLIKDLNTSVIIVADGGLGTINSTLLTVEYAKANNIEIAGIVLNNYIQSNIMHEDNLKQTEFLTGIKVIAKVGVNGTEIPLLKDFFS